MLGRLNEKEIEQLLSTRIFGHLGCSYSGRNYVVPVNYFYRDSVIYAHSGPGEKIEMMRNNPEVCFQVEDIRTIFRWKSVIAWGTFEEITDEDERQRVMQGLIHRIMPLTSNPDEHPWHGIAENETDIGGKVPTIVYKIKVHEKSGRFEEHSAF